MGCAWAVIKDKITKLIMVGFFVVIVSVLFFNIAQASGNDCDICMGQEKDMLLDCSHELCSSCYDEMKSKNMTCPFCRKFLNGRKTTLAQVADNNLQARIDTDKTIEKSLNTKVADLYSQIRHGHVKRVKQILQTMASAEAVDVYGNTPLHIAAQNGKLKITELLLGMNFDFNAQNSAGQTPLHYCVAYKFVHLVNYLTDVGASDTILNKYGMSCYDGLSPQKK